MKPISTSSSYPINNFQMDLFENLRFEGFSIEESRLITSCINLIIDNTSVEPGNEKMKKLISALKGV